MSKPTARELLAGLRCPVHCDSHDMGECDCGRAELAARVEAVLAFRRPAEMGAEDARRWEAGEPVDRYWLGWDDALEIVLRLLNGERA